MYICSTTLTIISVQVLHILVICFVWEGGFMRSFSCAFVAQNVLSKFSGYFPDGGSTCAVHPDVSMEFRVFMADSQNKSQNGKSIVLEEKRVLRFWLKAISPSSIDKSKYAYDFFSKLVKPDTFPKGWLL